MDLFKFLIVKPFVWLKTHIEGHHVEASATAEIEALRQPLEDAATALYGAQIGSLLSSNPSITEAQVNAALAPKAEAEAAVIVDSVPGVPAKIRAQVIAYVNALIPEIIATAYAKLTHKP